MADVTKGYGIGDTVWVWYKEGNSTVRAVPQSRVVAGVKTNTAGNSAYVTFTNGLAVTDVSTLVTVFDTQALCATAIVTSFIAETAAAVALDVTTSAASTASLASVTLGRIS